MRELNRRSFAKELLELCEQIVPLLGADKIKISLTRHGGELVHKTAHGVRRLLIGSGRRGESLSIKGLSAEERYARIMDLRKQGFTQFQVAMRLGVSQPYVSQIEGRGKKSSQRDAGQA